MAKKTYMEKLHDNKDMPKVEVVSDPKMVRYNDGCVKKRNIHLIKHSSNN